MEGWIDGINLVITKKLGMSKACCGVETFSRGTPYAMGCVVGWRVFGLDEECSECSEVLLKSQKKLREPLSPNRTLESCVGL